MSVQASMDSLGRSLSTGSSDSGKEFGMCIEMMIIIIILLLYCCMMINDDDDEMLSLD